MLRILSLLLLLNSFFGFAQNEKFNFLKAGDAAPEFKVFNQNHETLELIELLKKGKVIVLFYRGAWCPYCNRHMSNLQDSLNLITEKGASIIVLSPEVDASIEKSISKTKATFNIVHDSAYTIMNKYGVAFQVDEKSIKRYKLFGIDLEEANGNQDNILPVPATFIINKKGIIDFIHFDENYKKRLSVESILKYL